MNKTLTKIILGTGLLGLTSCGNIQYCPEGLGECQFQSQKYYDSNPNKLKDKDIRMTVGLYKGYPHCWVEERDKDGKWYIVDTTQFNSKDSDYKTYHHFGWETLTGEKE